MIKRNILECMTLVGKAPSHYEGAKTYVSTGAVDCDHIDYKQTEQVTYDDRPSRANLSVTSGDILFAKMCGTKKTLRINDTMAKYLFSTGFCAVRANESVMITDLLYHLLSSEQFLTQKDQNSSGATQKAITNTGLKKITIQVPNLEEQRVLAAKLDCIEQMMAKRRIQIEYFDQLVKSRFIEMFGDPETNPHGWKKQRLDEICENLDNLRVPITSKDRKAGIYPYYGASGIVDYVESYIFDEDLLLISEDGANLVMRSTPIAFSVSGKVWVNNHAHVIRFNSKATQKYIEIYFSLIDISSSVTGTAQPKLNQAKLNAMLFCIPPIELQKQFVTFVEQTDKSKLAIQKSLEKLEILKKALMQKYFG